MVSADPHSVVGTSASRATGLRWRPPPMPVVLRIPRIVEETKESPSFPGVAKQSLETRSQASPRPQADFRWPVGIGVAVLMLVASVPWLIRWQPAADDSLEALTPTAAAIENNSDIEILPPLYAKTISSLPTHLSNRELEAESNLELESLAAPHPVGGPQ